jgi:CheY-like chemotaxis protein
MKIALLVDDDLVTNFIIKKALEKAKIFDHVVTAENGEKALELIKEYIKCALPLPCFILLDLKMPQMGGFEFLEAFRKLHIKSKIEILISTTSDHPADIKHAKQLGVKNYFIKPWPVERLISHINRNALMTS